MEDDVLLKDDRGRGCTLKQIQEMLETARRQGHSLEPGTYLESMTLRQLWDLVHGRTDA